MRKHKVQRHGKTIGLQIGGDSHENVVAALREALRQAIERGQNEVAKTIAEQMGRCGVVTGASVSGCSFNMNDKSVD